MLLAAALRTRGDARPLRRCLVVTNVLAVVLLVVFVTATGSRFVGLFQLLYSLAVIPWIGVSAYALLRRRGGSADAVGSGREPEAETRGYPHEPTKPGTTCRASFAA